MRRTYIQVEKTEKMEKWRYYRTHEEIPQGIISSLTCLCNISSPPTTGAWHSRLHLPLRHPLLKSRISTLSLALIAMHTQILEHLDGSDAAESSWSCPAHRLRR